MRAVSAEPTSTTPEALYVSSRLGVRESMSSPRGEQLSEGGEEFRLPGSPKHYRQERPQQPE